jgi:hypothetical protein
MGTETIAAYVRAAGGIFDGVWETPAGSFAVVTEPESQSTILAPIVGLSIVSVHAALAAVRQRFGIAARRWAPPTP